MKVIRKYNQLRRDCSIEMQCEGCDNKEIYERAYDDRNFWNNVVPNLKCDKCKKTSNDFIEIKYSDLDIA